jgi:hypothetical protein
MRPVRAARTFVAHAFDGLLRSLNLPNLDLRERELGGKPPIIAVMRRPTVHEGELLGFAPGEATKADQPKDAGQRLNDHRVSRKLIKMGEGPRMRRRAIAADQMRQHGDMALLSRADAAGELLGPGAIAAAASAPLASVSPGPGETGMAKREPVIRLDRPP